MRQSKNMDGGEYTRLSFSRAKDDNVDVREIPQDILSKLGAS